MSGGEPVTLEVGGRAVVVTHPDKLLFPAARVRKIELVQYYVALAEGALRGAGGRPCVLVRHPNGLGAPYFFQKRAPEARPDWIDVVALRYPSGRTAQEVVPRHASDLAWMANLACLELHPHPVRADDTEHPDELRIDLDPVPGVEWPQIVQVAGVAHVVLKDAGLAGWPKTSGSRGIHVLVRIERRWTYDEVRRAALALAREVERRAPGLATSAWHKEQRQGVFVDYNQNARDRTVCSAWSVRARPDARVSTPVDWRELKRCDPAAFTLWTIPARWRRRGDPHAAMDEQAGVLDTLLEWSARDEAGGDGAAATGTRSRPAEGPLIEAARVADEAAVQPAIDAWKKAHPEAAARLAPRDVLVDRLRGRSSLSYRVRINLARVPERLRPAPARQAQAPKTRASS
ncbi:MAG: non-homologous end-joining DNA ligase [Burkholderiales bacterium]|nr:non-homologous end-joining DNA ligase [Burkholderiales bacterium]